MKDIELPPLSKFDHPEPRTMQWSDLELYAIKSYARAAVEADRAKRVPDGWKLVPVDPVRSMVDAAERVDWADSDVRGNIYNMWNVMLASTPAPAQQELEKALEPRMSRACLDAWDKSRFTSGSQDAVHPMFLEAFSVGFKAAAQHQEPPQQEPTFLRQLAAAKKEVKALRNSPMGASVQEAVLVAQPAQQERKPMTEEQVYAMCARLGLAQLSPLDLVAEVERHHGIKEQT